MTTPAAPVPGTVRLASSTGRWLLACTVLASGMAMLDGTVVTIALPRLGRDLHASLATLQWTVNAYMLTLAGLILLGGGLGDRYGRRKVFTIGVVWFALASALCGFAPNSEVLIAARALQGVGGALLTPGSLALVQATYHPDDRAKAVGAWSGLGGVASALGPFLGGWLVDGPGWRWIFLINLPFAAAVVLIAARHIPESRDEKASGSFDNLGALLAAICLAGITYALIAAGEDPASLRVWIPAGAGLLSGLLFVRVERHRDNAMAPPEVFASRQFTAVNLVTLCLYAAIGGIFFILPVQLQTALGYSALESGIATIPVTVLMLLFSAKAGALGHRIGPRIPLTVGPLVSAAGLLLLHRLGPGSSYWTDALPAVVLLGAGMTIFVAPLTATVLASVDVSRSGIASGINNTAARCAQLLIVAALPLAVGLSDSAYTSAAAVDRAFGRAVLICAGLFALGGVVSLLTVRSDVLVETPEHPVAHPECTTNASTMCPPLEPGGEPGTEPDGKLEGERNEKPDGAR